MQESTRAVCVHICDVQHSHELKGKRDLASKVMRVNYTTYDVRRVQDCINPHIRSDVIFLSSDEDTPHPYVYGRVCGIFHASVRDNATNHDWCSETFLLVRWYTLIDPHLSGFQAKHLDRLSFMDTNDPEAFSIVNPAHVIRGVHIIPRFRLLSTRMDASMARRDEDRDRDYKEYYVNV